MLYYEFVLIEAITMEFSITMESSFYLKVLGGIHLYMFYLQQKGNSKITTLIVTSLILLVDRNMLSLCHNKMMTCVLSQIPMIIPLWEVIQCDRVHHLYLNLYEDVGFAYSWTQDHYHTSSHTNTNNNLLKFYIQTVNKYLLCVLTSIHFDKNLHQNSCI